MCGRGHIASSGDNMRKVAQQISSKSVNWEGGKSWDNSRYVFHPGCEIPVLFRDTTSYVKEEEAAVEEAAVSSSGSDLTLTQMTWGLVPSFTKVEQDKRPNFFRYFNARSETCSTLGVYSRLLKQKRCIVVMDGFFEWNTDWKKEKQPYYVRLKDGPMFLAGLYDIVSMPDGSQLRSVTLLTTSCCEKLAWLHDRMPVLLQNTDDINKWLDIENHTYQSSNLKTLLKPYNEENLIWHPVGKIINKIGQGDNENCVKPIQLSSPSKITSFFGNKNQSKKPSLIVSETTEDSPSLVKIESQATSTQDVTSSSFEISTSTQASINVKLAAVIDEGVAGEEEDPKVDSNIELKSKVDETACPSCTYLNPSQGAQCAICGCKLSMKKKTRHSTRLN